MNVFIVCFKKAADETYMDELKEMLEQEGAEVITSDVLAEDQFEHMLGAKMLELSTKGKHTRLN